MTLQTRRLDPEWMDEPDLDGTLHRTALRGLARINRVSNSSRVLWIPIQQYARRRNLRRLRVLDIASGGGDMAINLWKRAAAAGLKLEIMGSDISETAVDHARQAASNLSTDIRFEQRDVLRDPPQETFDVITCSLFLHHLTTDQAIQLLRTMSRVATGLLLVSDLVRSRRGHALASLVCRTITRSPVVHLDGPRSVANAFTVSEVESICRQVPLPGATVTLRWPCRLLMEWGAERGV